MLLFRLSYALIRDEKDGKSTTQRPIADPKYWSLLQDILASSISVSSPRPLKGWLVPLLFRVNLAGIVEKLLTLQEDCNDLVAIYAFARAALTVIWPLAEKRVGMDALVECLSAVLCACAGWTTSANDAYQDDLASICSTVVGSYSNALSNFGNKKKVSNCIERRPSVLTCIVAIHHFPIGTPAALD